MSHPQQQRPKVAPRPGDILVAIHDFDARGADELTLRKTDQIELVELDEGFGDGWYLGRHLRQNQTGLFPGVYTAKLPPNFFPVGFPALKTPPPTEKAASDPSNEAPRPSQSSSADASRHRPLPPPQQLVLPARGPVPSPPSPSFVPGVHRSIGQALAGRASGEESPVMNETLSVIDEHITDLSTPRQSLAPPQTVPEDSESDYSSHLDRVPYVAGPETDSEENVPLTESEVKQWDARQTAEYLRSIGVDSKHCEIFEEQEITGDVLLEMDQSFIHMKEFDFGLMGRRLKTWHKIRDLQSQIQDTKDSGQSSLKQNGSTEDIARVHSRALSGTTILPRIPSLMEEPGLAIRPAQHTHPYIHIASHSPPAEPPMSPSAFTRPPWVASTPPSPWRASMATDSPTRPSASFVREMSHSRRHSSIDFAKHETQEAPLSSVGSPHRPHKKNASLDRDWSMSNATTANAGTSTPSLKLNISRQPESVDMPADSPLDAERSILDLDRGYFSGNEVDNRKARTLVKKRGGGDSAGHSRQSSVLDDSVKAIPPGKRHSRLSSVDSIRERGFAPISAAAKAYHSRSYKGRFRSASARSSTTQPSPSLQSPMVTNLEDDNLSAVSSPKTASGLASPVGPGSMPWTASTKARKLLGIRAASEAVTGNEKEAANSNNITSEPLKESPAASPSGSQTPSATSRSFEIDNTDTSSKGTTEQLGPLLHTKMTVRTNPKTKRQTSAYTRGLLPVSPADARKNCDYHGWMKKRSTGIVAQWKPRLFILRGRRLSYYYAETDTEEKGIIDISGHKVLGTTADPITSLHATITGAKTTPPTGPSASSAETSPNVTRSSNPATPFYFKLVPPKAGSSRGVQFTKPNVHVFQVDNIAEGRKWMGAILKATIEHDLTSYETTNRQKTISLAKARARKERPPALRGSEGEDEAGEEVGEEVAELAALPTPYEEKEKEEPESGLNIQGLDFNESEINLELSAGASAGTAKADQPTKT